MAKPSNSKTEQRALNALESIIDEHLTMSYQFNSQDKEMSWDGYIDIFKVNNGDQSKANFDDRVPVQIKGHFDEKQRYIKKDRITYEVKLVDLRAYSTGKGVLYFQVFLCDNQREIFYTSLFPSKILDCLEKAEKRHNEKSINIPFYKLKKDSDALYCIVKQFSNEGKKQGSGFTPLVQDRIKKEDFDKIKSIKFSVVGAETPYEALLRLSSGDVCFYGKTNGDKHERPLEWLDDSVFYVNEEVHQNISVGEKTYYNKYKCTAGSDGGMVITLSPNLKNVISDHKIQFTAVSTLDELYIDARFLLDMNENKSYGIAGHEIPTTNFLKNEFEKRVLFFIDLYEALQMINFEVKTPWNQLTKEQIVQFQKLVDVFRGYCTNHSEDEYYRYQWSYNGKNVPIIVKKNDDNIELINAVYTEKIAVFLPNDDKPNDIGFRMPLFASFDAELLSNLYYNDYDCFRKQIDTCDINEKTKPTLNDCALKLINVFDINGDYHFLDLAEYLMQKLEYPENDELFLLNKLQIKKRRRSFDGNDIELLKQMNDSDIQVDFGRYVLLEDKEKASKVFEKFSDVQKEYYKGAPIYKLYVDCSDKNRTQVD